MKYRSYSRKCLVVVLALTALCLAATSVMAAPIVYNFYGTGWGDLNGTAFDALPMSISIPGDTLSVNELVPGSGLWVNDTLTGTVNIPGIGLTGTFTDSLYMICYNGDLSNPPLVGFGDSTLGFDLLNISPLIPGPLSTYNLQYSFGPTALTEAFVTQFGGIDITPAGGLPGNFLTFDFAEVSFNAVGPPPPPAAPLPAGIWLLGSGLLTMVGIFRRNRS